MPTNIDKLRTACRRCLDDSDDQLRWLGRSLQEFLAHRCRSVDEALGLQAGRGGIPWWREEANRKRDAALRQLAARHLAGLSITAQARQLHVLTVRYAGSTWRFDRTRPAMPTSYTGSVHECLWLAFSSGAPMPIGQRQLRNILPPVGSSGRKDRVSDRPALSPAQHLVGLAAGA